MLLLEGERIAARGERAQRRLLPLLPHPRRRQRPRPLPGRDAGARAARARELRRARCRRSSGTGSTAPSSSPAALDVAVEPHEVAWLAEEAQALRELGHEVELLDRERVRAEVDSPLYEGGVWQRSGAGAARSRRGCAGAWPRSRASSGVRIHEQSRVAAPAPRRAGRGRSSCRAATVRARSVAAGDERLRAGLVAPIRRRVVPVYDYVLVSEPLSGEQLRVDRLGEPPGNRRQRQPVSLLPADRRRPHPLRRLRRDLSLRQPHRARARAARAQLRHARGALLRQLPAARGAALHPSLGRRDRHLQPLLRLLRHRARRARRVHGRPHRPRRRREPLRRAGRARPARGRETEATRLRAIRSRPLPFPPEPLRWAAIELTRRQLAAADRRAGRRGLWLRALDRAGLGFDS